MARPGLTDLLQQHGLLDQGEAILRGPGTDLAKAEQLTALLTGTGVTVSKTQVFRWRQSAGIQPEVRETKPAQVTKPRGAPKGNHNAVTTGEYETLWDEGLSERERVAMRAAWELPALDQVHRQLGLLDVRIARALERIKQTRAALAAGVEMALDSRVEELVGSDRLTRVGARDTLVHQREILERQEASLDRMLQRRERLLALKVKIEALDKGNSGPVLVVDLL